jgi:uncharacterized protein YjbI with pentapeptide repeats
MRDLHAWSLSLDSSLSIASFIREPSYLQLRFLGSNCRKILEASSAPLRLMPRGIDVEKRRPDARRKLRPWGGKPVGLETRPLPEGSPATDEFTPVENRAPSPLPELQAPGPAASPSKLPDFAAKADDLEAIKKAVDDAASVGGGLWLSYLFVLFYLAVAAGAVTHADLFLENPVKLPFLNIELPLLAFFFLAPILFIIVHAYTLVHLVFLTDKAKRFDQALYKQIGAGETLPAEVRDRNAAIRAALRRQLPSNIFVQFLAGASDVRDSAFGYLLRAIAWVTLVVAPVLLLLMMQIQFLPFHSSFITWTQRAALLADLVLIWWLWRKILSGRMPGPYMGPRLLWATAGVAFTLGALLFSWTVATFPGEWQDDLPNQRLFWFPFPKPDRELVTLHRLVFESKVDETTRHRRLPFSSTLVLTGFNVLEGLGIDDPKKAEWRDFVFRARGRDLRGAIFDFAILPRVDFTGADLDDATFTNAQLDRASFERARLQSALFDGAGLQGASFATAQLQGASLVVARLQGASLHSAELQGASLGSALLEGSDLGGAHLQGASLDDARLQGASLSLAQLQAASLSGAQLQAASLMGANLQAASLKDAALQGTWLYSAQLQGASLDGASIEAADLSSAFLWRGSGALPPNSLDHRPAAIWLKAALWNPVWTDARGTTRTWDKEDFRALRALIESLPAGRGRDKALKRLQRLNCSSESDPATWSCRATPENDPWRKALNGAGVGSTEYEKSLAAAWKAVVCASDPDAIYVLRGLLPDAEGSRSSEHPGFVGSETPALVDFIMSKVCPVSAVLTDTDRANLLAVKAKIEASDKALGP